MKSKKDQGNEFFKKSKFAQAVACYNEYVKADNSDNSKAYSNMALCHFKLKQYESCIKASQMAVQLEPQFQKPYFRMYQSYKQLKDNYGAYISGLKFCKITKDEKQISAVQKELVKIKEDLSFNENYNNNKSIENIIQQIKSLSQQKKDAQNVQKQPQISLQSKWERIQQKVKTDKRQGLNMARKFVNQDCSTTEEKDKYKKLMSKLRLSDIAAQNQSNKTNQSSSVQSDQDVNVEELKKYNDLHKQKQTQNTQKKVQQQEPATKEQGKAQLVPQPKSSNETVQPKQSIQNHNPNQSSEVSQQSKQNIQKPIKITKKQEKVGNWQEFVSQEQSLRLFDTHIYTKLQNHIDDPFQCFYECLCNVLRSTELDQFQKQAILQISPDKVKKFKMIMKSYSGAEKKILVQLFTQNNLQTLMEKYNLKK